jgi:hypothetical protein
MTNQPEPRHLLDALTMHRPVYLPREDYPGQIGQIGCKCGHRPVKPAQSARSMATSYLFHARNVGGSRDIANATYLSGPFAGLTWDQRYALDNPAAPTTVDLAATARRMVAAHRAATYATRRAAQAARHATTVSEAGQVAHAALDAEWREAFDALRAAGLASDADDPTAARYRAASAAVNHSNRSRDFAIATGQINTAQRPAPTAAD